MSTNSTASFTINSFPTGKTDQLNARELYGTIAIATASSATVYPTYGIPISFASAEPYSDNNFFWGQAYGVSGYVYVLDPAHQTIRIYQTGTGANDPLNEVSATPTGVSSDTIYARVIVERT